MKVLIVYAHPEPQSYNAMLLARGRTVLEDAGHEVVVSDLYAMQFDPVAKAEDFRSRRFPDRLFYDREQKHAVAQAGFSADIATEIEKLLWCDALILHFPLWWFSVPAILKGWFDRVFANGVAYGGGRRYETGGLQGRRAMVVTSTAAYDAMCGPAGLVGHLDVVLWPLQNGTLAYSGFDVLPPFVSNAVSFVTDEQRSLYVAAYEQRLREFFETAPLPFHKVADFGPDWILRSDVTPRAVGQAWRRGSEI